MCHQNHSSDDLGWGEIENRYLDGLKLSDAQFSRALEALGSPNLRERIVCCVAILCDRDADERPKLKARQQFEHICSQMRDRDDEHLVELLFTLLQLPIHELINSGAMRALAYHALNAARFSLRANAILVLERLAKEGDTAALSLIERTLNDTNERVRTNAQVALRNIKRSAV